MNKIITSFNKFNESKHANIIADSKQENEYLVDAKKLLADAKKLDLNKAEDRSYLSQLKEHIKMLSNAIDEELKSPILHAKEKLEKTIKNCKFK
jgi:hypothetical protein